MKVLYVSKFSLNGGEMVTTEDRMTSYFFTYFVIWLVDLALVEKWDNLKVYQTFQFWLLVEVYNQKPTHPQYINLTSFVKKSIWGSSPKFHIFRQVFTYL